MASYLVICFQLMHYEKFTFVHRNLYYFGHWALPLGAILATILPKVKRDNKSEEAMPTGADQGTAKKTLSVAANEKKDKLAEGSTSPEGPSEEDTDITKSGSPAKAKQE